MAQRITGNMMISTFLNDYYKSVARMQKYEREQTGRKLNRLSDDPVGVVFSMKANRQLNQITQYERNIGRANEWLTVAEDAVMKINNALVNVYVSVGEATMDGKTANDRRTAIYEAVNANADELLDALNANTSGQYIFGGYNTTQKPFEIIRDAAGNFVDIKYNGISMTSDDLVNPMLPHDNNPASPTYNPYVRDTLLAEGAKVMTMEVGLGLSPEVTTSGLELIEFVTPQRTVDGVTYPAQRENIFTLLQELLVTLKEPDDSLNRASSLTDDPDAVDTGGLPAPKHGYIARLQAAQNHMLALTSEYGGRTNRMEMISSDYEGQTLFYTQMKSDYEDSDVSEAIMNFKMAETVYKALLSAGASIIKPTLMDYLR